MKLVVVEIDEDPSETVELIELQLPGAWLGGDGREFGGDDLNQINILDYLDDANLPESSQACSVWVEIVMCCSAYICMCCLCV